MAHSKSQKSTKLSQKQGTAKKALKKKHHLASTKSRNEDLREKLDRVLFEEQTLRSIHGIAPEPPSDPHNVMVAANSTLNVDESLSDITKSLVGL